MRNARQTKIVEIIDSVNIETQSDLCAHLKSCGFNVTQTTVSRDIKALKLVKVLSDNGVSYRYAIADAKQNSRNSTYKSLFSSSVTSVIVAGNLVIIKTIPGGAILIAKAIDTIKHIKTLGSVAGYDTLFLAVKDENEGKLVKEQLEEIVAKNGVLR